VCLDGGYGPADGEVGDRGRDVGEEPCADARSAYLSIREFCEPSVPILMFAKNGDYIATTLEVVSRAVFPFRVLR